VKKRSGNEKRRVVEEEEEAEKDEEEEEESDEDGSWSIYRARSLLIIHVRDSRGLHVRSIVSPSLPSLRPDGGKYLMYTNFIRTGCSDFSHTVLNQFPYNFIIREKF